MATTTLYSSLLLPWGSSSRPRKAHPPVSLFPTGSAIWSAKKKAAAAAVRASSDVKYMGTFRRSMEIYKMLGDVSDEYNEACKGEQMGKESDRCLKAKKAVKTSNKIWWEHHKRRVELCGVDPLEDFCKEHPDNEDCRLVCSVFEPFHKAVAANPRAKKAVDKLMAKGPGRWNRYRGTYNKRMELSHEVIERRSEMLEVCEGKDILEDKGCVVAMDALKAAEKAEEEFEREIKSGRDPFDAFCKKNPEHYLCELLCDPEGI